MDLTIITLMPDIKEHLDLLFHFHKRLENANLLIAADSRSMAVQVMGMEEGRDGQERGSIEQRMKTLGR